MIDRQLERYSKSLNYQNMETKSIKYIFYHIRKVFGDLEYLMLVRIQRNWYFCPLVRGLKWVYPLSSPF